MKKLLALILSATMVVPLFACNKNDESKKLESKESTPNTAMVIGSRNISATELNYFYIDCINNWYSTYGSYASYIGLDTSLGLDDQIYDDEAGTTWADYFLDQSIESARNIYALCDAADKAGYSLSSEEQTNVDLLYATLEQQAKANNKSVTEYLQSIYGEGATEKTYKEYYEDTFLASAYYSHYAKQLKDSYTADDLRAYENDEAYKYNSYSYASYYLSLESFELTDAEHGKELLEQAKTALSDESINTVEKLNSAIAQLEGSFSATATENKKQLYSRVSSVMQEWIRDDSRKNGDITALRYESTSIDANGEDIKELKGYYIVLFQDKHDNSHPLANVRHILAAFEGGTSDSLTGQTSYSDAEKKAARDEAERLLLEWKNGAATEESFAELANKNSDDGDGTTGGLYENVYPGQMVTNFNDWCFADGRKAGDYGIVETEYGYHIMYYSGDSDENYRDYMVTNDKLAEEMEIWLENLLAAMTVEKKNLGGIDKNLVLSENGSSSDSHEGHNH